jgi:hypothetical protein
MVKVQAPAFSLEASGQLGGAIVFSKWKGRPYVRALVKPANPKSGGQVGVRAMFKFLSQDWTNLTAGNQASWETRADQKIVSPFNAFMGYNQFRWRDFLAPTVADPEATGDTPATVGTTTAVAGVRSITVTVPITTAADGWGVLVFRSLTTAFATAFDNLIGVVKISGTDSLTWVDSPLVPDTYYYNFREFTEDGQLNTEDGEINATVT